MKTAPRYGGQVSNPSSYCFDSIESSYPMLDVVYRFQSEGAVVCTPGEARPAEAGMWAGRSMKALKS